MPRPESVFYVPCSESIFYVPCPESVFYPLSNVIALRRIAKCLDITSVRNKPCLFVCFLLVCLFGLVWLLVGWLVLFLCSCVVLSMVFVRIVL